jgi:hypothetical protein
VLSLHTPRAFFANQLRAGIQSDAVRVSAVAQRVVEEYEALRQREQAPCRTTTSWWASRAIGQTSTFHGPLLLATASPICSSPASFHAAPGTSARIVLDRMSSYVNEEEAGGTRYTL